MPFGSFRIEKNFFIRKILIILLGHLWIVELTIYKFLPSSLHCLPPVSLTNLPPVSLTLVANLPPVSIKLVKLVAKSAAGVVDTVVHLDLRISPRIFEKIWNGPNGILWGWGETDSWKNQKQKISWHCLFKVNVSNNWTRTSRGNGMCSRKQLVVGHRNLLLAQHNKSINFRQPGKNNYEDRLILSFKPILQGFLIRGKQRGWETA